MTAGRIDDCVEDALADFDRQGRLALADVQRLIDHHRLEGAEAASVFSELRASGIDLGEEWNHQERLPATASSVAVGDDTIGLMFRASSRMPLLTAEEEVLLGRRIWLSQKMLEADPEPPAGSDAAIQIADGKRAHDKLVLSNLRLVASIAKRYRPEGMEQADLLQEGAIGLMRAADKFDHTLGFKFSTYATWWIRQSITRALADKGRVVRLPVHMVEKVQRINREQRRLEAKLQREPDLDDLASSLDLDRADIKAVLDLSRDVLSLDAPVGEDGDADLATFLELYSADVAEQVEALIFAEDVQAILRAMELEQVWTAKGAASKTIEILRLRFGLRDDRVHTLEEIGDTVGVTRERVRQIINKALRSDEFRKRFAQTWTEGGV